MQSTSTHQLVQCVLPGFSASFAQWRPKFEQNLDGCLQLHGQSMWHNVNVWITDIIEWYMVNQ